MADNAIFSYMVRLGCLSGLFLTTACSPPPAEGDSHVLDKITFDLHQLDETGLYGPPGGQRSLDYEFCLPQGEAYTQAVVAIDPSLNFYPGSRGRRGCTDQQILAIGNTHQPNAQRILMELAQLDYIDRIDRVDWE
jgi:hypothetical protein